MYSESEYSRACANGFQEGLDISKGRWAPYFQSMLANLKLWRDIHSFTPHSVNPRELNKLSGHEPSPAYRMKYEHDSDAPAHFSEESQMFWFNFLACNWQRNVTTKFAAVVMVALLLSVIAFFKHSFYSNPASTFWDYGDIALEQYVEEGFPDFWKMLYLHLVYQVLLNLIITSFYFYNAASGLVKTTVESVRALVRLRTLSFAVIFFRLALSVNFMVYPWMSAHESPICKDMIKSLEGTIFVKNYLLSPNLVVVVFLVFDMYAGASLLSLSCPNMYYHPIIYLSNIYLQRSLSLSCFSQSSHWESWQFLVLITAILVNTLFFHSYAQRIFNSYNLQTNAYLVTSVQRDLEKFQLLVSSDLKKPFSMMSSFPVFETGLSGESLMGEKMTKHIEPLLKKMTSRASAFNLTYSIMKNEASFDHKIEDIPFLQIFSNCAKQVLQVQSVYSFNHNLAVKDDSADKTMYVLNNIVSLDYSQINDFIIHTSNSVLSNFITTLLQHLWDLYQTIRLNEQGKEFQNWSLKHENWFRTSHNKHFLRKTSSGTAYEKDRDKYYEMIDPLFSISASFISSNEVQFMSGLDQETYVNGYYLRLHVQYKLFTAHFSDLKMKKNSGTMLLLRSLAGMSGGFIQNNENDVNIQNSTSISYFDAVLGLSCDPENVSSSTNFATVVGGSSGVWSDKKNSSLDNQDGSKADQEYEHSTVFKMDNDYAERQDRFRMKHAKNKKVNSTSVKSKKFRKSKMEKWRDSSSENEDNAYKKTNQFKTKIAFALASDVFLQNFANRICAKAQMPSVSLIDHINGEEIMNELAANAITNAAVFLNSPTLCLQYRANGYRDLIILVTGTLQEITAEVSSQVNYVVLLPCTQEDVNRVILLLRKGGDGGLKESQNSRFTEQKLSGNVSHSADASFSDANQSGSEKSKKTRPRYFRENSPPNASSLEPKKKISSLPTNENIKNSIVFQEFFAENRLPQYIQFITRSMYFIYAIWSFIRRTIVNLLILPMIFTSVLLSAFISMWTLIVRFMDAVETTEIPKNNRSNDDKSLSLEFLSGDVFLYYLTKHKPNHDTGSYRDDLHNDRSPTAFLETKKDFSLPSSKATLRQKINFIYAKLQHFLQGLKRKMYEEGQTSTSVYYGHSANHKSLSRQYNSDMQIGKFYFLPVDGSPLCHRTFSDPVEKNYQRWKSQRLFFSNDPFLEANHWSWIIEFAKQWSFLIYAVNLLNVKKIATRDFLGASPFIFGLALISLLNLVLPRSHDSVIGWIKKLLLNAAFFALLIILNVQGVRQDGYNTGGFNFKDVIQGQLESVSTKSFFGWVENDGRNWQRMDSFIQDRLVVQCSVPFLIMTSLPHLPNFLFAPMFTFFILSVLVRNFILFHFITTWIFLPEKQLIFWLGLCMCYLGLFYPNLHVCSNQLDIAFLSRKNYMAYRIYLFQLAFLNQSHENYTEELVPLLETVLSAGEKALETFQDLIIQRSIEFVPGCLPHLNNFKMGLTVLHNIRLGLNLSRRLHFQTSRMIQNVDKKKKNEKKQISYNTLPQLNMIHLKKKIFYWLSRFCAHPCFNGTIIAVEVNPVFQKTVRLDEELLEFAISTTFMAALDNLLLSRHLMPVLKQIVQRITIRINPPDVLLFPFMVETFMEKRNFIVEVLDTGLSHDVLRMRTDSSEIGGVDTIGNNHWNLQSSVHHGVKSQSRQRPTSLMDSFNKSEYNVYMFGQNFMTTLLKQLLNEADNSAIFKYVQGSGGDSEYGSKQIFSLSYQLLPPNVKDGPAGSIYLDLVQQQQVLKLRQIKDIHAVNEWLASFSVFDDSSEIRYYSAYKKHDLVAAFIIPSDNTSAQMFKLEVQKHGWICHGIEMDKFMAGNVNDLKTLLEADCLFLPIGVKNITGTLNLLRIAGMDALIVGVDMVNVHQLARNRRFFHDDSGLTASADQEKYFDNGDTIIDADLSRPAINKASHFSMWTPKYVRKDHYAEIGFTFTINVSAVSQLRLDYIAQTAIENRLRRFFWLEKNS